MPDEINGSQKPIDTKGFTTKPLEQPIFDQQTKNKFSTVPVAASGNWFKDFYASNKIYIWAIVVGLVIIGVLAYLAFRKVPVAAPKEADIAITVDAPSQAPSGGELLYKINIANHDSQKLVNSQLELVYPDGVTYIDSTPKKSLSLSGTTFAVPDLLPKDQVAIFVKVKITGNVNDAKTLGIKFHYHFANFSSEFVKSQTYDVRLAASDVLFEFDGPTMTNNAQLVTYTLKYKNNSQQDIKDAQVRVNFPANFSVATTQPNPDTSNNIWSLSTLPVGSEGSITFQGTYNSAAPGESRTLTADLLVRGSTGQSYVQTTAQYVTSIASVPLFATQEFQNNNNQNVINPGDTLVFDVKYQNNSSVAATGVNLLITLDSKALDLSSLQAEGAQVSGNTIQWNGTAVPSLASLPPSGNGTVTFTVRVKNPVTKDSSTNLSVNSSVQIKSNEYPSGFPGNQIQLKVSSTASVGAKVDYTSGSLPPKVGTDTFYKVTLSLKNSTNDFSNGVLTASLPSGASGFDQSSVNALESSKVSFDSSTGKLTWNVGALSAHTGDFKPARTLTFTLKLNPSKNQAGKSPTLLTNISFTGTDIYTTQTVTLTVDDISTSDVSGGFNGQVEP
jgi:hypothetical protein